MTPMKYVGSCRANRIPLTNVIIFLLHSHHIFNAQHGSISNTHICIIRISCTLSVFMSKTVDGKCLVYEHNVCRMESIIYVISFGSFIHFDFCAFFSRKLIKIKKLYCNE